MRLTRATAGVPPAVRLAWGMLLMGLPLLVLAAAPPVQVIAGVIAVFVVGEMLWIPTSQAVAARLAPAHVRGTYFGALSATTGRAWTFAPLVGAPARGDAGPGAVWTLFAAVSVAGAATGVAATVGLASMGFGHAPGTTRETQPENDERMRDGKSLTPCLWFDTEGEEAAKFYTSVFPNSRIVSTSHYGEAGPRDAGTVMTVDFELDGTEFIALNGGPEFTFTEAISFQIDCKDQDEVDRYWEALSEGGEEGPCGWLKDRYGLSWQVVPTRLRELLADPDQEKAQPGDGGDAEDGQDRRRRARAGPPTAPTSRSAFNSGRFPAHGRHRRGRISHGRARRQGGDRDRRRPRHRARHRAAAGRGRLPGRDQLHASVDEAADELADQLAAGGGEAIVLPGSIADPATGPMLAEQTIERFGRMDVLVNNAGDHPRHDHAQDDRRAVHARWWRPTWSARIA